MMNRTGYAPFQIVMGKNNFASGLEDGGKPDLEQIPFNKIRQKYLESENETKINLAMINNKRQVIDFAIEEWVKNYGNVVITKSSRRGPAKIIVKDGDQCILRHGGLIVSSHARGMRKFRNDEDFGITEITENHNEATPEMTNKR